MSELVTGEAVQLELRLAKFATRVLAITIDLLALAAVALTLLILVEPVVPALDTALAATVGLVTVVTIVLGIPVTVETLTRGRSLGKLVMGLRVVRDDGGPVRLRHSLARGLAGVFIDFYPTLGSVAILCSLLNKQGKRVGDLIAGTVVIRERAPATGAPLPAVPPHLSNWAVTLEMSRVPDDLAIAARRYLAYIHDLAPQVRDEMGARLATEVSRFVTPPAPPGTPAWAYLTAVLSERARREALRLGDRARPESSPGRPPIGPVTGAAGGPRRSGVSPSAPSGEPRPTPSEEPRPAASGEPPPAPSGESPPARDAATSEGGDNAAQSPPPPRSPSPRPPETGGGGVLPPPR